MPAMMEDPTTQPFYRTSGDPPYPGPGDPLPVEIVPRQVTLRDRVTAATIIPFSSPDQVPPTLLAYLSDQFAREIEKGDTYPMLEPLPLQSFGQYWFGLFGAIMLLGQNISIDDVHSLAREGQDWETACLGSFYIKPNYPGRSSHICNGGFLVTDGARNRGVGRLMGETYLEWAPKLGYRYSVFNLVYETNVVSCRIWDALGFKRIGRVKGAGNLRSYPGELVDAIIYGRDLYQDDDFVSEERFDKIRFYLKNGKYPNGADRAEKSRLRSAATHYSLVPASGDQPEKLMLKGKEVISDPQKQYEIARQVHHKAHGGINKTTASIAEAYHWVRIKETVSQVIRNCPECSEMNRNLAASRKAYDYPRFSVQPSQLASSTTSPTPTNVATSSAPPPAPMQGAPPPAPQPYMRRVREESPSMQLQLEAAAQSQLSGSFAHPHVPVPDSHSHISDQHTQFGSFEMPVDPALMDASASTSQPGLANLPPSPFLSPYPVQNVHRPDLAPSDMPPGSGGIPQTDGAGDEDAKMSGMVDQRAPTGREEINRRLTRAGFRNLR